MPNPDDSFDVEKYILDKLGPPIVRIEDVLVPTQEFVFCREFPGLYGPSGLPPADGGPDPHYRPTDNPERLMIVRGANPLVVLLPDLSDADIPILIDVLPTQE